MATPIARVYNLQKRILAQNPFAHQIGVKRAYNSFIVFARALAVYEASISLVIDEINMRGEYIFISKFSFCL